jgi:Protein of unknown function (DUF1559)
MAIAFSCECGRKMQAKEEFAGKRMKCPGCKSLVTIPKTNPKRAALTGARPAAKPAVRKAPAKATPARAPAKPVKPPLRRLAPQPDPVLEELTDDLSVPERDENYEPDYDDSEPEADESQEPETEVAEKPRPLRPLPFLGQYSTPWQGEDQRRFDPASQRPDARDKSQWLSYTFAFLLLVGLGVAAWWFWDDIRAHLGFPKRESTPVSPAPVKSDPRRPKKTDTVTPNALQALDTAKRRLHDIAVAMNDYVENYKRLPPAAFNNNLSWRVAILPYLGKEDLYKQFKLDEPWNSEANLKLLDQMPPVYAPIGGAVNNGTHCQVFTGANTLFDGETHDLKFKDAGSQTILVVEAKKAVPWTAPSDVAFEPGTRAELGAQFQDAFLAVFADFTVHALPTTLKQKDLEAYITPNGGEAVPLPDSLEVTPALKKTAP